MAGYLGQYARQLELVDQLCGRFPTHALLQSQRLHVLQRLGNREAADQLLERMVEESGCDPTFVSELGELLLEDSRQLADSGRFLRRAVRMRRSDGRPLESLALWQDKAGNQEEASRLRRYASCLSPTWEPYARGYFDSCRIVGRIEEGLTFLERRVDRLGRFQSDPWLTQAGALDSLRRSEEALTVLEKAVAMFPDNGELRLRAGRMMMGWGEAARTKGLSWIEEARGKVSESYWLRQRAGAAIFVGDRPLAIRLWRSLLALEPTATDACQSLAHLLAEEKGQDEAMRFLEEATRNHPRSTALWGLMAQWKSGPGESMPALDRLLDLDPNDLWARRERALKRFDLNDREGGLSDARDALSRNFRDPDSLGVLASLLNRNGNVSEALTLIREALTLCIDQPFAIRKLIQWSQGKEERENAISFIASEMSRQVSNGDCVQEFQIQAWQVLPPPDLMARLQEFCKERPDLWQTWQARLDQALRMDLLEEAKVCADKLTASFPLLPRTWMEEAKVRHAANDIPGELEALRKAVDLSPAWDIPARKLSEALERTGRFEEAEEVLRRAIRHEPLECVNHGLLADLLLKQAKTREAYDQLGKALEVGPYYHWGWMTSARLSVQLGCGAEFLKRVEEQSSRHGHNSRWWAIAAEIFTSLGRAEDALDAAHKGLELAPDQVELRDLLAETLCGMERYDEALDVCSPKPGTPSAKREIAGRRAWVLMASGDGPAAIQAMTDLLEKEPDYAWGWGTLSGWYSARGDWKNLSMAATQWTRFSPDHSTAHGHLGLAAEKLDDKNLAKRAYERAFLLDPEYQFAGRKLFKLRMESREYAEAFKALSTLRHFTPGPWVECDAISLALAQNREAEALDMGGLLCLSSTDSGPIEWLSQEFSNRGLGLRWFRQTEEIVKETPSASTVLLHAWADQARHSDDLDSSARRLRKFKIPENSRNAAWAILLRAARTKGMLPLMEKWISKERVRFTTDAGLWNVVGELFVEAGMPKKTIHWLKEWNIRLDDVGSHTLVNLSAAVDTVKGPSFASEIRMAGIARFRGEVNAQSLRAGQAAYLASINRIDEAAEILAPVEDDLLSRYYYGVCALARSVVAASRSQEQQSEAYYKKAIEKLGVWPADNAVKWYVKNTQKALAVHLPWASGKGKRIFQRWGGLIGGSRYYKPLGIAALVLLGIGLVIAGIAGQQHHLVLVATVIAIRQLSKSSKAS